MSTAGGPRITSDNLVMCLDAHDAKSYSGGGSTENVVINTNLNSGWSKGYCEQILWNDYPPPRGVKSQVVSFIDLSGSGGYWYSYGDYAPQADSTVYSTSIWARTVGLDTWTVQPYTADNSESNRIWLSTKTVYGNGKWQRLEWDAGHTTPSGNDSDSLSFHFPATPANQRLWLCAPQMEASSKCTPFINTSRQTGTYNSSNPATPICGTRKWGSSHWTANDINSFNSARMNNGDMGYSHHTDNADPGAWLKLDVGAVNAGEKRAFTKVIAYAGNGYIAIWNIQYSDDDSNWTTVYTGWDAGQGGSKPNSVTYISSKDFGYHGKHRYWRLYKTNSASSGSWQYEIQWVDWERSTINAWKNRTGNSHHGSFNGGMGAEASRRRKGQVIEPKSNAYIDFDGTDDYIRGAQPSGQVGSTTAKTYDYWFKMNSGFGNGVLIMQSTDTNSYNWQYVYVHSNGSLQFHYGPTDAGGYNLYGGTSAGTITADVWTCIAISIDVSRATATDRVQIYKNAEAVAVSWNGTYTNKNAFYDGTDMRLYIGAWNHANPPSPSNFFDGQMGRVSIWKTGLTAQQVKANFNAHRGRYGV